MSVQELDLTSKDGDGHLPLTAAAAAGDLATVEKLVDMGANVNARGQSGETAITHAARRGHVAIVQLLVSHGARVDSKSNGHTPLMAAAYAGHLECVKALVEAGAKLDIKNFDGHTALCEAYAGRSAESVLYLLGVGAPIGTGFPGTRDQLVKWAQKFAESQAG